MRLLELFWFISFLVSLSFCLMPQGQAAPLFEVMDGQKLEEALKIYETMNKKGEWPLIPDGEKLKMGDRSPRVEILRKRLKGEKYLMGAKGGEVDLFDADVDLALKEFQKNHGLLVDGELGKNSINAFNASLDKRICQIRVNLERLRTSPLVVEPRAVVVNVPDFTLTVYENDKPAFTNRVIVGQRDKKTPLLDSQITYLVLNPAWNVPRKIAVKEELAHIQKDPNYLARKNMKLIAVGENPGEVDPATIDWSTMTEEGFNYRLVQKPGQGNALGTIKFMFPNPYDVYLHDTSNRSLFLRGDRALSHGCVRVENPLDLAEFVLKETPDWTKESVTQAIHRGGQKVVPLNNAVPVHIIYVTSWVDSRGIVQFRNDLYKRDPILEKTACAP